MESWGDDRLAMRTAGVLICGVGIWRVVNSVVNLVLGVEEVSATDEGIWPIIITLAGASLFLFRKRPPLWVEIAMAVTTFLSFPARQALYDGPNASQIYLYPVVTILTFAWVGMFEPRRVLLGLMPVAVVCQMIGLAGLLEDDALLFEMAIGVSLVAVLVGFVLGEVTRQLRLTRDVDHRRVLALQELAGSIGLLRAESTLARAVHVLAEVAQRCFHTDQVIAVVDVDGGPPLWSGSGGTAFDEHAARATLEHTRFVTREATPPGGCRLWIPLVAGRDPVAAVRVDFDEPQDEFVVYVGELFAAQATPVIEQARLMEALVDDANRDELTGLGNRRFASTMLADLQPGDALILVDLDHFKDVNDNWGHAAGDQVLREVGTFLISTLRGSDRVAPRGEVARYGGEEFLLLIKQAGFNSLAVAERLVSAWRQTSPRTTFSAGVAVHRVRALPAETLDRADAALYEAKRQGRDRACSADGASLARDLGSGGDRKGL
jgi:diguanylate cyclase (GGDEF)-like protein